jgi:16S rRNA G1207 methylase RsmC
VGLRGWSHPTFTCRPSFTSKSRQLHPNQQTAESPRTLKFVSDRLLAELSSQLRGPNVLVILMHGTTLASALRELQPDLKFTFFTTEHFFYRTLQAFHADAMVTSDTINIVCAADLPDQEFDEVIFPTLAGDSSELAQDLVQAAHQRLRSGGRLFASTNNPKDRWVQSQLKTHFSKVEVQKHKQGTSCIATKTNPLKKEKGFRARFAFRQGERLAFVESRPGVFCHRRVDAGGRALIRSIELLKAKDGQPEFLPQRIVEMGCGAGPVSVAAAIEYPTARILAVDSDARAIECTQRSAELNEITTIQTLLTSDGVLPEPGTWDLLLGNPPYYSDYRISELFMQAAKTGLREGGRIHIVTKLLEWHQARMEQLFAEVTQHVISDYTVFTAVARNKPGSKTRR